MIDNPTHPDHHRYQKAWNRRLVAIIVLLTIVFSFMNMGFLPAVKMWTTIGLSAVVGVVILILVLWIIDMVFSQLGPLFDWLDGY